jgi:hypothetical protein
VIGVTPHDNRLITCDRDIVPCPGLGSRSGFTFMGVGATRPTAVLRLYRFNEADADA